MARACCSVKAGDSSARRTRSPCWSLASRPEPRSSCLGFKRRWRPGFALKASRPDVLTRRWLIAAAAGVALLLLLQPVRGAALGRLARPAASRREHRDRGGGAEPLSAPRRHRDVPAVRHPVRLATRRL